MGKIDIEGITTGLFLVFLIAWATFLAKNLKTEQKEDSTYKNCERKASVKNL